MARMWHIETAHEEKGTAQEVGRLRKKYRACVRSKGPVSQPGRALVGVEIDRLSTARSELPFDHPVPLHYRDESIVARAIGPSTASTDSMRPFGSGYSMATGSVV